MVRDSIQFACSSKPSARCTSKIKLWQDCTPIKERPRANPGLASVPFPYVTLHVIPNIDFRLELLLHLECDGVNLHLVGHGCGSEAFPASTPEPQRAECRRPSSLPSALRSHAPSNLPIDSPSFGGMPRLRAIVVSRRSSSKRMSQIRNVTDVPVHSPLSRLVFLIRARQRN